MPDSPSVAARSPLGQERLSAAAGPDWTVRLHAEAASTNALAAADPARNLVVVADHQTAGRGRLDRTWETPPGAALTFSAVVDPVVDAQWWPLVPLVAGYAVARTLAHHTGAPGPLLKWPNDVLLGGAKICGILVERVEVRAHQQLVPYAVIGIGINVGQTAAELPGPGATSLALSGHVVDRTVLFGEVLQMLRGSLGLLAMSPSAFAGSYRALSATLGRDVRVELPGGRTVEGRVLDIDEHGQLVVQTAPPAPASGPPARGRQPGPGDPGVLVVAAGDVVHVRPR